MKVNPAENYGSVPTDDAIDAALTKDNAAGNSRCVLGVCFVALVAVISTASYLAFGWHSGHSPAFKASSDTSTAISTNEVILVGTYTEDIDSLGISGSGKGVYIYNFDETTNHLSLLSLLDTSVIGENAGYIATNPSQTVIYVSNEYGSAEFGKIYSVSFDLGKDSNEIETSVINSVVVENEYQLSSIAVNEEGSLLAASIFMGDGGIAINSIDSETGGIMEESFALFNSFEASVHSVKFIRNDLIVATGFSSNAIYLLKVDTFAADSSTNINLQLLDTFEFGSFDSILANCGPRSIAIESGNKNDKYYYFYVSLQSKSGMAVFKVGKGLDLNEMRLELVENDKFKGVVLFGADESSNYECSGVSEIRSIEMDGMDRIGVGCRSSNNIVLFEFDSKEESLVYATSVSTFGSFPRSFDFVASNVIVAANQNSGDVAVVKIEGEQSVLLDQLDVNTPACALALA